MRSYSAAALTALAAGAIVKRRMILFELASNWGYWDGSEPITPVDGVGGAVVDAPASGNLFQSGGSLFEIELGAVGIDGAAPEMTIRLRAVPSAALSSDVLQNLLTTAYKGKKVSVFRALFSTSGTLIEVALRYRGYFDSVAYIEQPAAEGPGLAYLEAKIESPLIEAQRKGAHDRNDESQRLTFANDDGLRNIDRLGKIRRWAKGVKN